MQNFLTFLYLWAFKISCFAELSVKNSFITLRPGVIELRVIGKRGGCRLRGERNCCKVISGTLKTKKAQGYKTFFMLNSVEHETLNFK